MTPKEKVARAYKGAPLGFSHCPLYIATFVSTPGLKGMAYSSPCAFPATDYTIRRSIEREMHRAHAAVVKKEIAAKVRRGMQIETLRVRMALGLSSP